jgi:molybdopterin-guanine dinucleotide biosynthesis protein A
MSDVLKDFNPPKLQPPYGELTGVILAGGKSRRYGRNKALVKIDGIALIERVLTVMDSLFQQVILITNTPEAYAHLKLTMHEDIIKNLGPLGGIYTALRSMPTEAGFVVACDMPFLNRELIRYMIEIRGNSDVVVPKIDGFMEALHALYGKRCLPFITRLIEHKHYQIIRMFPHVSVRHVLEAEIRRFDPDLKSFLNINKPQHLRRFKIQ